MSVGPATRSNWRRRVVAANAAIAGIFLVILWIGLQNPHGISGIALPFVVAPMLLAVIVALGYSRPSHWPLVVLIDGLLMLYGLLGVAVGTGSDLWLVAGGVAAIAGYAVVSAVQVRRPLPLVKG